MNTPSPFAGRSGGAKAGDSGPHRSGSPADGSSQSGSVPGGPHASGTRAEVIRRRTASVSLVTAVAIATPVLLPVALPLLVAVDIVRLKWRLPLLRLYAFAICWAWLELAGVSIAAVLWLIGRRGDLRVHYRLQAWWADKVMGALRVTCGLRPEVRGSEVLRPGPTILLGRHASLADSLLTAWVITNALGMRPRVVMKKELMVDPCLDVVGTRLPNSFVDRSAVDSAPELDSIRAMVGGLTDNDVAVLFPEGTRANPAKRSRAISAIRRHDPDRAAKMEALDHLLPPRPGGAAALLASVPQAAVCVGWHIGFEGLDSFSGIIAALGTRRTRVRIRFRRVNPPPGAALETGGAPVVSAEFIEWLDDLWLQLDRDVDRLLDDTESK